MRPPTAPVPHSEFCGQVRRRPSQKAEWGTPAWSLAQQPDRIGEATSHCMRTTRSGMEPRRCRVAHAAGVCREVRVAPDVFVCAEPEMPDSSLPLPLRERVRQGVRGGPRAQRVRPRRHSTVALMAFSVQIAPPERFVGFAATSKPLIRRFAPPSPLRGEGSRPPASPRAARLAGWPGRARP